MRFAMLSLTHRFVIVLAGTTAASLAAIVLGLGILWTSHAESVAAARLAAHAELLAVHARPALVAGDHKTLQSLLETLRFDPGILRASAYSPAGTIAGRFEREEAAASLPGRVASHGAVPADRARPHDTGTMRVVHPIVDGARLVGTLYIEAAGDGAVSALGWPAVGVVAASVGLAGILGLVLIPFVSRPVHGLAAGLRAAAADGDRRARVDVPLDADTRGIVDAFNDLLATLESREAELRRQPHAAVDAAGPADGLVQVSAELAAVREKYEASTRAKTRFLAMVSHELRTPMNGIFGMVGLLLDSPLSPEQRDQALTVQHCAESLLTIVNDVRDFAKIEAGTFAIQPRPFDVFEAVEEIVDLLAFRVADSPLELVVRLAPGSPRVVVADESRFRQVLLNLATNAVTLTREGSVSIEVECLGRGPDGRAQLRCVVRDTGPGIHASRLPELFRPLSEADPIGVASSGGGLGLAICRRLVELMGGELGVESTLGVGSRFFFSLPLPVDPGASAPADALGDRHVLVVDDVEAVRRAIVDSFVTLGVIADSVPSLAGARAALQRGAPDGEPFDFVLVKEELFDGPPSCHVLSGDVARSRPPVHAFVLTRDPRQAHADFLRARGFAGALLRPVRPLGYLDALARGLRVIPGRARTSTGPARQPQRAARITDSRNGSAGRMDAEVLGRVTGPASRQLEGFFDRPAAEYPSGLPGGPVDGPVDERVNGRRVGEQSGAGSHQPPRASWGLEGVAALPVTAPGAGDAVLDGAHVLLVEDNVVNQKVAVTYLRRFGCQVDVAANGVEALRLIQGTRYALVLMDCQMPEMDGFEATRAIRGLEEREGLGRLPIVAMTANAMNGDREKCLAVGMDDYISKPVKPSTLRETVGRWLVGRTASAA